MATLNEVLMWNKMADKSESSDKTYNKLMNSLPNAEFGAIKNLSMPRKFVILAIKKQLGEMYLRIVKQEKPMELVGIEEPKYVARLFRNSVVVWKKAFYTEEKANKAVANMLMSDSTLTIGNVESIGIVCEIDRMKASAILSNRVSAPIQKKLSFGGGKIWMKANQTRVVVSRG